MDPLQKFLAEMNSATRVPDRKAAAQSLSDYLENNTDNVCVRLDFNSVNSDKKGCDKLTWTRLFLEVKEAFNKEAEKKSQNKLTFFGVVKVVFTQATRNHPWLQWSKVCEFLKTSLLSDKQIPGFGPALINMLERFLSIELYKTLMDAPSWMELIETLIRCHGKGSAPVTGVLHCLNLCISQGSMFNEVIPVLRARVVDFYIKIMNESSTTNGQNLYLYLRGVTNLTKINACEFRGVLCKLGETVIPSILQISSFTDEQEAALSDFLLAQFRLHMPCDVEMSSEAFYANDSPKWKEILRLMYSYCIDAIDETASKRSMFNKTDLRVRRQILLLAAKCTKQISSAALMESNSSDEDDVDADIGNSAKKTMRYKSFHTIINDVYSKPPSEGLLAWFDYLTVVLNNFPELVDTRINYSNLIHLGNSLFNTPYMLRKEFHEYFLSLLKVEKCLRSQGKLNDTMDTWSIVWDLTIKSISVCEDKDAAITLLRRILHQIHPTNLTSLLMLFVSGTMPLSKHSVLLLAEYLTLCSLPLQVSATASAGSSQQESIDDEFAAANPCPRLQLLKWLMKLVSSEDTSGIESLIATVMCSLLVKQSLSGLQKVSETIIVDENEPQGFEKLLMKSCFVHIPKRNLGDSKTQETDTSPSDIKLKIEQRSAERLAAAIRMDFENIPKLSPLKLESLNHYRKWTKKLVLYLSILDSLEKYEIEEVGQRVFRSSLEEICQMGLATCNQYISDVMNDESSRVRRDPGMIEKVIGSSRTLFTITKPCDKIRVMLTQGITPQNLDLFKRVFRSNLAKYVERMLNHPSEPNHLIIDPELPRKVSLMQMPNGVELELLTKADRRWDKMSGEALNFLIDYGLVGDNSTGILEELMKDLSAEGFCSANGFLIQSVAILISSVARDLSPPKLKDLIPDINILLQKCCRGFYLLPRCSEALWKLFKSVIPAMSLVDAREQHNTMVLIVTLYNFLKGPSAPRYVLEQGFETLRELAKHDPSLVWSLFNTKDKPTFWVLEDIGEFLCKKSHQVRMTAVDTICVMFENASPFDYSNGISNSNDENVADNSTYQGRRKKFLTELTKKLASSFDVDYDLSSVEQKDESANRTSFVLLCLARLIFAFPYTQKQTITSLFVMLKMKNINAEVAQRALQYISVSSTKTMCSYFRYAFKKVLKLHSSLEDIPYQFFGCDSFNTFISKFRDEICVEYFEQNKMPELEAFSQHFNTPVQNLIRDCYGFIMAKITPGLANPSHSLNGRGVNLAANNEVHRRLITILGGKEVTDTLMGTCLGDVVFNLISMIFEPTIMIRWGCPDIKLAEPVPPHHSQETVESCLAFLKSTSPHPSLSVIGHMANKSHKSIYKIMLNLNLRIHEAHDELQKYWRLHQLKFFVDLLLNEPRGIFNSMKEYVCTFVFNAYLRLLKSGNGDIRFYKVVVQLMHSFVVGVTRDYPDEMKLFFVPVVRSIVSASMKHLELLPSSQVILDFLIKENANIFTEQIKALDPFPANRPEFRDYHFIHQEKKYGGRRTAEWPLAKEFERVLEDNGVGEIKESCTKESLQFLRELLSKRKRDLERMVKNLEHKRFSEECATEPLQNLIQMLIGITLNSTQDPDVVNEACKCLGEIGPVDLSILVLPYKNQGGRVSCNAEALEQIIKILMGYQSADDMKVVAVSEMALRSMCQFAECPIVELQGTRLSKTLLPFIAQAPLKKMEEKVDANLLEMKLGLNEMNEEIEYGVWIKKLTTGIIECFRSNTSMVATFLPMCELRVDFCEDVFPYVVYLCLVAGSTNPLVKKTLTGYFRGFFNKFANNYNSMTETTRSFTPSSNGSSNIIIYMNKLALRLLIRVVQFLRRHTIPQENKGNLKLTPWFNNFWLDINYLDVARAAQFCGAYLTSILYVEIAATEIDMARGGSQSDEYDDDSSQDEPFSQGISMYVRNKGEAIKIQKLLLRAYSSIGEVDAAYGCGSARFSDAQSSMYHLEQSMEWHRLLMLSNGSSISTDVQDNLQTCSEQHVALSLKQLGLHNILWTFLKGVEAVGNVLPEDVSQAQYECGWRLSKWDIKSDKPAYINDRTEGALGFQKCIYDSIHSGLNFDIGGHLQAVKNGLKSVYTDLRHATLESSENVYGFLSRFQMLRVVENFFESQNPEEDVHHFLKKWKLHDRIPIGDFKHQEPILSLRNVLLRAYDQNFPRVNLEQEINESLLDLIGKARNAGRLDLAESCATAMNSLHLNAKARVALDFEAAKNHWARGKGDIARDIMNKLIKKSSSDEELYPAFLLVYGEWLSISHCERPASILKEYLQKSCNIYEKRIPQNGLPSSCSVSHNELSKAYFILAKYADAQYQNVTKYIGSEVFQAKVEHLTRAMREEQTLQVMVERDGKISAQISKKQSAYDHNEIQYIRKEHGTFLELALIHYMKGLNASNENDLLIFRAISLWLENDDGIDIQFVENTTEIFKKISLPSYKYIVVLHQLSARLSTATSRRNQVLRDILHKCAIEHPYHTLPVLLTQANLHKDDANLQARNTNTSLKVQLADRVKAAANLVQIVKSHTKFKDESSSKKGLVSKMEDLWHGLIILGNYQDGSKNVDGVQKEISKTMLAKLSGMEIVAVPTSGIPLLSSLNYKDCVIGIFKFESTYSLVGGINSPKKIQCIGTNGLKYNMLLKGQDDLRQDAVMQQVFGVLNSLLQVEPAAKARRLHIRSYKVVPLSQRTGVLEWVENTQTLGDYLVGSKESPGAHLRYRPDDYKPMQCRLLMLNADKQAKETRDLSVKNQTYMQVCAHFKPVFRHFFFENFVEAGVFFEKRLAYIRSVATTSIVGYILGLGDRHVLNILIDKKTAEFIHIDLGVAFEQGRNLPTPETIPFRLSRDVIDGMGISGVEGVFKKSCEETMHVLRNNAEIILTVLQVLLYDPLYTWSLTNDRVAKVQPSGSSAKVQPNGSSRGGGRKSDKSVNATVEQPAEDSVKERNNSASRVLLRLRQKLMGIEEDGNSISDISCGASLSVDGHVSLLIQRAIDPDNLCRLFPGWQPYL